MKTFLLFACLLFIACFELSAQRELLNPLLDSKKVIAEGTALHDSGNYKAAITEYLKVPPSDTGYASVLHEIILNYYSDSNFVAAENYAKLALERYPAQRNDWYGLLADIYDDTKRTDLALRAYDTVLSKNPNSYV